MKTDLRKMKLDEAIILVRNKKGAGVSKTTYIDLGIQFKGSVIETDTFLTGLKAILSYYPMSKIIVESEVKTEMQNNIDWEVKI